MKEYKKRYVQSFKKIDKKKENTISKGDDTNRDKAWLVCQIQQPFYTSK